MAKHVRCSFCGDMKWMEYKHFKENLMVFRAENHKQLNDKYVCRTCRTYKKPNDLKNTKEFKGFKRDMQEIVDEYVRRGWNNADAENFCRENVEALLAVNHIGANRFKVVRDGHKIKGFLIMDIPLWHEVLVEIDWKE